jgi:hypothetical protein
MGGRDEKEEQSKDKTAATGNETAKVAHFESGIPSATRKY